MKIKCLLISPLAKKNEGYSGEDAYTENLLKHPPEGVEYYFYKDLIAKGYAKRLKYRSIIIDKLSKCFFKPLWAEYFSCDLDFDIIHIHAYSVYLTGGIVKKNIPVILSESSCKGFYQREFYKTNYYDARRRLFFKVFKIYDQTFNIQNAKKVIVWSYWAKKLHEEMGIKDNMITVVPPGIRNSNNNIVKENKNDVTLLFIGNDFERKGGHLLLSAYKKLRGKYKNIELLIFSSYPAELSSSEYNIKHSKDKDNDYIFKYIYPQADIFILPALAEGFGISIIEAMMFGLPVITSDIGPFPEIVKDGENGFLIDPKHEDEIIAKLDLLIGNPELRKKLGKASRIKYENEFSIKNTNKKLEEAYIDVLK
ncbi:MAG: glycosyltransferase family 4 protein [bacterium]|nr:glycosyltransferase family 4 protein [bacterium]